MSCRSSQIRFVVVWLPLLLSLFFDLCESQTSGNVNSQPSYRYRSYSYPPKKSAFSDPGVIIGIIVGVVGVLVVVGVTILLCRLFCCKRSSCCSCCSRRSETYLEASTVPIKIPAQDGGNNTDNNKPISTISQDHPTTTATHSRQLKSRKTKDTSSPNPPQYDDIQQQFDWKANDLTKSGSIWDPDLERRPEDFPTLANDEEIPDNLPAGSDNLPASSSRETKKNKPTAKTRRKLLYEADVPDVVKHSGGGEVSLLEHEPKKRNPDTARHGREFPERRKRHFKPPSLHEDDRTTVMERSSNQTHDGGREFPLLEYEPRTFNFNPSYGSDNMPRTLEDTYQGAVEHMESPSVEYEHQNQHSHFSSYADDRARIPDDRSRIRAKERGPREHTETPAVRLHSPLAGGGGGGYSSSPVRPRVPTGGRVNLAYNQESTETVV